MKGVIFSSEDAMMVRAFQVWRKRGGFVLGDISEPFGAGPFETRARWLATYDENVFKFLRHPTTGQVALVVLEPEFEPIEADELGSDWG